MNEEIIIINNEPFYKILNGTSYDYAPIPKEFKPYFEKLQQENQQLKEEINKISKKELKVIEMLYSIENGTLTRERIIQIEEVLFEIGIENND